MSLKIVFLLLALAGALGIACGSPGPAGVGVLFWAQPDRTIKGKINSTPQIIFADIRKPPGDEQNQGPFEKKTAPGSALD